MKAFAFIISLYFFNHLHAQSLSADTSYIKLSQTFLYAVKTGDSSNLYMQQLASADLKKLHQQLINNADKKAFWLNLYNAFVQKILTANPDKYKSRSSFFSKKQIIIGGKNISLDEIEHGILRKSKVKWSLGYFNKVFPSKFEKNFRVETLDNRIHFALNCGAKSCPPIAYYHPEKINIELDLAAKNYLTNEVTFSKDSSIIYLPKTMNWFRKDFGGKRGMKNLLAHYKIISNKNVRIKFKPYNWSLFLNNYKAEAN